MMNNDNKISQTTKLYGYIGEHAGVSRFSVLSNKLFKDANIDAMMIPMNIRADDLYFTISNMKKSHLNGAVISNEYITDVVEVLDETSGLVKRSGMCDILFRKDDKLYGDVYSIRVLLESLKDVYASKIALIGTNAKAKAFSLMACGFSVSYFNDNLEELMKFCSEMEISNADINRIADGMSVDLSGFDAVLDFSQLDSLDMIEKLPKQNFDMKNDKEYSALKTRAHSLDVNYTSYDAMLERLTQAAFQTIKNKG